MILLLLYQLLQRRRREDLQRQLEHGTTDHQYDLQHFRVPRDILDRLPVYVYSGPGNLDKDSIGLDPGRKCVQDRAYSTQKTATEPAKVETESKAKSEEQITRYASPINVEDAPCAEHNPGGNARDEKILPQSCLCELPSPAATVESGLSYSRPRHAKRLSQSQTTCAICLDDFVPSSSTVRELPCGHIYHPECIDVSLTRTSSLCPLCKKSVLAPELFPIAAPEVVYGRGSMRES
ncbi:hypothetical protein BDW74DRAFT_122953 [Aspergillus multicolor]|uniref:E3 ubiquitin-protein ligase RNF103 n=1 Tax=Aspergillus multicolor TaxID=41759 RepID=UPI003CCCE51E